MIWWRGRSATRRENATKIRRACRAQMSKAARASVLLNTWPSNGIRGSGCRPFGVGLDAGNDAALDRPAFGGIAEVAVAADLVCLTADPAHGQLPAGVAATVHRERFIRAADERPTDYLQRLDEGDAAEAGNGGWLAHAKPWGENRSDTSGAGPAPIVVGRARTDRREPDLADRPRQPGDGRSHQDRG